MKREKGLGRGLEALLGGDREPGAEASAAQPMVALALLSPGRYQPRSRMDEGGIQELAESIRDHGLIQPIAVRPLGPASEGRYEIIAGERRFRAAKIAGISEVPVIVRHVSDQEAAALALIENIQRENLNPIEEANGIKRLIDEFKYSHEQAASAIGRSRSATSNLLRLLNLAEPVQTMLLAGDLDMGHARALVGLDRATQLMLASQIVEKRLSVREAERLVTTATSPGGVAAGNRRIARRKPRDLVRIEEELAETLGTEVSITVGARKGGSLTIRFHGHEQFEDLVARLRG